MKKTPGAECYTEVQTWLSEIQQKHFRKSTELIRAVTVCKDTQLLSDLYQYIRTLSKYQSCINTPTFHSGHLAASARLSKSQGYFVRGRFAQEAFLLIMHMIHRVSKEFSKMTPLHPKFIFLCGSAAFMAWLTPFTNRHYRHTDESVSFTSKLWKVRDSKDRLKLLISVTSYPVISTFLTLPSLKFILNAMKRCNQKFNASSFMQ